MAKLRRNHADQAKASGGMIAKVGIFGAIAGGLYFLFSFFSGGEAPLIDGESDEPSAYVGKDHFLPSEIRGSEVYHYKDYTLSYNEDYEQADWVAYVLTNENLIKPWTARNDNFRPDPAVRTGSASPDDYRGSGYDRGHMVPAADMAYDAVAMDETFLMSNISPQSRNFNQGIWRELEELTRDWAKKFKRLYIATGPVLSKEPKGYIGKDNEVAIPAAYYKVILDLDDPEQKGIGFILDNEVNYEPLYKFAVSIDEVEALTGIDFYEDFMPVELEDELEGNFNIDLWPFNKGKYELRVEKWNQ
ncbi:MAG: DNA/RNA non-specific endonuclease [Lewinella sp.]|jgi:endonuclease G|uniref:DNA/RNA non-specific endonuclease n=1 Tax=Lewinella sp. TaxID=2004506 RepID=UPI003D6C148A